MEVGVFTAGGYKFLCRSRNAENMNSNGHSLTDDAPQQKCKTNAKYVFSSLPLWLLSSEWAGVWDQWHHYWWIPHIVSSPDSNISCLVSHSHISAAAGAWSGEFLTLCHSLSASCLIRALSFGWPDLARTCDSVLSSLGNPLKWCCRVFLCRSRNSWHRCCDWLREDRPIRQYKYTNININTNTKIYVVQMWKYSITQINIHKFLCRSSGGNSWHRCDWLRQMDRHSQTEQCEDISDTSKYIFVTVCVQCNCKVTSYTLHIYIQVYSGTPI